MPNPKELDNIVAQMHSDLDDMARGYVRANELKDYVEKLIADQQDLPHNPAMGFWGLDEPENMPSDARVDYLYMPTYIATGMLVNRRLNYPAMAQEVPGLTSALKKGLCYPLESLADIDRYKREGYFYQRKMVNGLNGKLLRLGIWNIEDWATKLV